MGQSTPIGSDAILIVEDEALVRFEVVASFEERGWKVHEAEDADPAIALLSRHSRIRVVITDVQMPGGMDALRLTHYVRDRFPPTLLLVASRQAPITPTVAGAGDVPPEAVRPSPCAARDRTGPDKLTRWGNIPYPPALGPNGPA